MIASRKQIRLLTTLGLTLASSVYYSFFSGPSAPSTPVRVQTAASVPAISETEPSRVARPNEEFHPVLRWKRKEDRVPVGKIDPRIHTDILANLQAWPAAGGRNLFQFAVLPPKRDESHAPAARRWGPQYPPEVERVPNGNSDRPSDTFSPNYYGLATVSSTGRQRAFFLDGEDIIIRAEGETVKGHYRLLRIGVTSVLVEDTHTRQRQTIQISEPAS